ncbi:Fic family protein [Pedobacter sp. UYP1]|uniref:Fic family protein n=1 Tax=Pedobacter sp. UYP1 TaxID=1756396 RepID=UPI003399BF2F
MYIHQQYNWPDFYWNTENLSKKVGEVRHRQGKILGQMSALGFDFREETILQTLTLDVTKSSEIEGVMLSNEQVRSSIAKRLGIEIAGAVPTERHVDGVVEMMLNAIQHYQQPLSVERLTNWHGALFPTGRSGLYKLKVAELRDGPMQVVSGTMGKERIHFEAPSAERPSIEMKKFIAWVNSDQNLDPVTKAAIAHIWFVTIHPFDDGNGRMTRAITDMLLARADQTENRFYSMSAQLQKDRNYYYETLEQTQKGSMDITAWINWFLDCLYRAMDSTDVILDAIRIRTLFWEANRNTVFNVRQQKIVQLLLDGFFGNLTVSKWSKITKSSKDTALRDIQDLIKKNILLQQGAGRSTNYKLCLVEKTD